MWLNPKFKVQVLKFVYDELIKQRHDAGDNYALFTKAFAKIVPKLFLSLEIQTILKSPKTEQLMKQCKIIDIYKML